ncbi:VWA domain-containing protein [Treponema parvum]|uniref:VWA domain-containing protein n=1 Tax=Treponema parvum TaxID=138851 RepID=A0A975EYA5_9SPIR|nr:VWA domain-containing protein [Treponema parvum]QTQ11058.1 VWA domain-containing protein [Treponema parvum]QTQ16996.1 VWA domain-containing protein [Treponema parvum]
MIDFMNPFAFLFFIPVLFLFLLRKAKVFSSPAFPVILSDWGGSAFKWKGGFFKFTAVIKTALFLAGYVLVVLAFADPVIHHDQKVYVSRGNDVLFVLDVSPSMAARDMGGLTRLEAAKQVIRFLAEQNTGASFGLVQTATEAALSVPPTTDRKTFIEHIDTMTVGTLGEGTAIGTGLSTAVYHLASSKAPEKCIILITDGENNAGSIHPETAASLAFEYGIKLYTVGLGTRGNVPLQYTDPVTGKVFNGYLESDFDPAPLQKIALMTDGRYFSAETVAGLSAALNNISNREKVVQTYYLKTVDEYFYDKILIAAATAFALAWILSRIVLKEVF